MKSAEYLELLKAGLNLGVALITLGIGWFLGQRFTVKWNLYQKRRETDIANIQDFHALYGEFKELSKLWRVMKQTDKDKFSIPPESRWLLLGRACALESKNEAIVIKLATERHLTKDDTGKLGLFRQALQTLRESIRDDKEIPFSSRGPEYVFVNTLAAEVATIISSAQIEEALGQRNASVNLMAIASVRHPDFISAMETFRAHHPELSNKEAK